jgi:PAS domain S-box-containing protein
MRPIEAHLRIFIDEAPVSVAMFDREMRYLVASRRWQQNWCPGEDDLTGRSHYALFPELSERWKASCRRGLAGETLTEEDLFPRGEGRTQWVRWEIHPWRRSDGEIGGIIIVADNVTAKVEAEQTLRESNAKLTAETEALARLHEAGSRLWQAQTMREGLDELLSATIELLGADMGNIQLLGGEGKVLHIAAQRGFREDFLELFREVTAEDDSACGRALRCGKPVLIEDVEQDTSFAPFRSIARAAGYRAVVSIPLIGHDGKPLGMISCHFRSPHRPSDQDLQRLELYGRLAVGFIERFRSEQRTRESQERYRLAVDAAQLATWDWDVTTGEARWNERHYQLFGYGIGEVEPGYDAWSARIHPDDRTAAEEMVTRAMREHTEFALTYRVRRPDGTVRWCSAHGRTFYDAGDRAVRMVGLVQDITETKQWEENQKILVAELQHRTRNLIAVVQSIAHQTRDTAKSLEDFEDRFDRRLAALSRVQDLLSYAANKPITIGMVIGMEVEALGGDARGERITLSGPEIPLSDSAVQITALAIHELATNALKYGALASKGGHLSVTWRIEGIEPDRRLVLEWVEHGVVPPLNVNLTRRGYGRKLIEQALPYSLSAQTKFELAADSLRCTISLPIATKDGKEVAG